MTTPVDDKIQNNSPAREDDEAEKETRFRTSVLPVLYGLAGANFVALIQFVSSEHGRIDWRLKASAQTLPILGLAGMIIMSVSIPSLILCAFYCEIVVIRKRNWSKLSAGWLGTILTLGIVGIALTLAALEQIVGIVFFGATALMSEWASNNLWRPN